MAKFCLMEEAVEDTDFADIAGSDCEPFVLWWDTDVK